MEESIIETSLKKRICIGVQGGFYEDIVIRRCSDKKYDKIFCWHLQTDKSCENKGLCLQYDEKGFLKEE